MRDIIIFFIGMLFPFVCYGEVWLFNTLQNQPNMDTCHSVLGCLMITLLGILFVEYISSFFLVDWKRNYRKYLKEFLICIGISSICPFFNQHCINAITQYGFTSESFYHCGVYAIIFLFLLFVPILNLRNSKW